MQSAILKALSFPVLLGVWLAAAAFVGRRLSLEEICQSPAGSVPEFFFQGDMWLHIKVGDDILKTAQWPTLDSYSFTAAGKPWVAYEWLGGVALSLAARVGGLVALMALLVLLAGVILLLLYYYAYLRSRNVKAAFVACALALPLASLSFALRPQLFGYMFLLITLICLERFRQGRGKPLWLLPPMFALWVNTHASFFWGLLALGVYGVSGLLSFRLGGIEARPLDGKQLRLLGAVSALSIAALGATPYGVGLIRYLLHLASSQPLVTSNFGEWLPLDFGEFPGKLFLGLVLLLALDLLMFNPVYRLEEVVLFVLATYQACVHGRFVLFFVPVLVPLLAARFGQWLPGYEAARDRYILNAALIMLTGAGVVAFFPSKAQLQTAMAREFPLGAIEYIGQHDSLGPMWNDPGWGGYLVWALGPERKVFIDGRLDFYEQAGVLGDFVRVARLEPDTPSALRKYGVRSCLVPRTAALGTLLAALPDWERVYEDNVAVIFVWKGGNSEKREASSEPRA